jgi:hypothetical protein
MRKGRPLTYVEIERKQTRAKACSLARRKMREKQEPFKDPELKDAKLEAFT